MSIKAYVCAIEALRSNLKYFIEEMDKIQTVINGISIGDYEALGDLYFKKLELTLPIDTIYEAILELENSYQSELGFPYDNPYAVTD